jgi:TPR repeat protein
MALSDGPAPKNLERARTVIAAGDIEAVRIALSRMIESGNASAAVDLGSTYDPNILDALGIRNFPADVSKARAWYQRAQQMGSPDAAGLLESLERSERPSR